MRNNFNEVVYIQTIYDLDSKKVTRLNTLFYYNVVGDGMRVNYNSIDSEEVYIHNAGIVNNRKAKKEIKTNIKSILALLKANKFYPKSINELNNIIGATCFKATINNDGSLAIIHEDDDINIVTLYSFMTGGWFESYEIEKRLCYILDSLDGRV